MLLVMLALSISVCARYLRIVSYSVACMSRLYRPMELYTSLTTDFAPSVHTVIVITSIIEGCCAHVR